MIDIDEDLKKTVTDLRSELYEHGVLSLSKLKKSTIYWAMPCNNDIKAQNYWQNNILSWIFQENVNFEITVKESFWWHGVETLGIACDLFKVNIVIYSPPNPKILVFIYSDKKIRSEEINYKNEFDNMEKYINKTRPTIFLIHSKGNHYKYFRKNNN